MLPLAVFMLVGSFEPKPDATGEPAAAAEVQPSIWALPYSAYPGVYTVKILLTAVAIALVWPGYPKLDRRISPLAPLVGVVGVVLWVGLWKLGLEQQIVLAVGPESWLGKLLGSGVRSAFNPLAEMSDRPALAYGFLGVRFVGLVLVIAVAEEMFLRGLLMRFAMQSDWWKVPIGQVNSTAVAVGTIVPMLMHPAELLAAAAWFSLVTWLMIRTRSIWDCVVAHATTNLLLGVYVVWAGGEAWQLL